MDEERTSLIANTSSSSSYPKFSGRVVKTKRFICVVLILAVTILLLGSNRLRSQEVVPATIENFYQTGEFVLHDVLRINQTKLSVSHAFINSVYFYPTSKSLGENAIAIVMAIDQKSHNVEHATFNLIGTNETTQLATVATSETNGGKNCRYSLLTAVGNTVANLTKLELESNGSKVEIPFKIPRYTAPKPVIICISPQFVAEQWQTFMMHVHVVNRFGGHMHMYLTSIIESYFELMREYERQGYLTLDFWLRMKFSKTETPYFEPNENVDWRNQAGAQTDCLLQYKEAAEYIAFFDMDDILFPLNYPTYLQEFNAEWAAAPDSNSMLYPRREHEFIKAEHLSEFSFAELVASLKSSRLKKLGKVVVKPERYNSTWLHYSFHDEKRHGIKHPSMIHVQRPIQKHGNNKMTSILKIPFGPLNETIREEDVKAIDEDIWRIRNLSTVAAIADKLPSSDFYLPIVFKCYYDAFYGSFFEGKKNKLGCGNADTCVLPQREDYKCVHSDADYFSGPHMVPYTFHFSTRSRWSWDIGCYQ